jgi:hypothetical protein
VSAPIASEVVAGLVVHLDPAVLRSEPGCSTTAPVLGSVDRAVLDSHFFLVLHVDEVDGAALAVPLYSHCASGSERLDESKKGGKASTWLGAASFYSPKQYWWIPPQHLQRAAYADDSTASDRRTYAADDPAELAAIADRRLLSPSPWRAL